MINRRMQNIQLCQFTNNELLLVTWIRTEVDVMPSRNLFFVTVITIMYEL